MPNARNRNATAAARATARRRRPPRNQRPEHHQKRQRKHRDRTDQHVADRLKPQQPPAALLVKPVGAIEPDAQALDAARGEIDGKHGAERQHAAAGGGQHIMDLAGDRACHLPRPGGKHQPRDLVGQIAATEKAGQRRHHNQKRKHRHQGRERDMARNRPAVVAVEAIERLDNDPEREADRVQAALQRGRLQRRYVIWRLLRSPGARPLRCPARRVQGARRRAISSLGMPAALRE